MTPPKRFLVFGGLNYYADGGWEDFKESFDTLDEALEHAKNLRKKDYLVDWTHIVDLETGVML